MYERGMVRVKDDWAELPHSCDEWVIGGKSQIQALIEDLQALVDNVPEYVPPAPREYPTRTKSVDFAHIAPEIVEMLRQSNIATMKSQSDLLNKFSNASFDAPNS